MSPSHHSPTRPSWLTALGRAAAGLSVVAISVAVFFLADRIQELKSLGYLGAFSIMLLSNATIVLPAPGLVLVFALGSSLQSIPLGLATGAGAALGELTGYLAGLSGRTVIKNQTLYRRFEGWMERYGSLTIFALAAIPNPFFDIAGVAAGALGFTWRRFLLAAWAGKTVQGILIAYAGAISAEWVLNWL